jgi:hypothetical protein
MYAQHGYSLATVGHYGGVASGFNQSATSSTSYGASYGSTQANMVGTDNGMTIMLNDEPRNSEKIDIETCPFHYVARPNKRKTYCKKSVIDIQVAYIIAAIIWIVLIFVFKLYRTNLLGWVILAIPLIVFALNYSNLTCVTEDVESEMLKGNFLSFAFLITVILINWSKIEDKTKYFRILLLALVFLMLSLVDIWVKPENMHLMRHIRTIFHSVALTLLVFALYMYYSEAIAGDITPTSINGMINTEPVTAAIVTSIGTTDAKTSIDTIDTTTNIVKTDLRTGPCREPGFNSACECANLSNLIR